MRKHRIGWVICAAACTCNADILETAAPVVPNSYLNNDPNQPSSELWQLVQPETMNEEEFGKLYEREMLLYPAAALIRGPCNVRANITHVASGEFRSWYLKGENFQRKALRYYEGTGPPPMDEVWMLQRSMGIDAEQLSWSDMCYGTFVLSQLLFAEYLYPTDFDAAEKLYHTAIALDEGFYQEFIPLEMARGKTTEVREKAIELREKLSTSEGRKEVRKVIDVAICHCRKPLDWLSWFGDIPKVAHHIYNVIIYDRCGLSHEMMKDAMEQNNLSRFWSGTVQFYALPDQPTPPTLAKINPKPSWSIEG